MKYLSKYHFILIAIANLFRIDEYFGISLLFLCQGLRNSMCQHWTCARAQITCLFSLWHNHGNKLEETSRHNDECINQLEKERKKERTRREQCKIQPKVEDLLKKWLSYPVSTLVLLIKVSLASITHCHCINLNTTHN